VPDAATVSTTLPYSRAEAKEWARAHLKGVCNVVMPTFTSDFRSLNEAAIAHDVRHAAALGFSGTLLVSECGSTLEGYRQFVELAAAAAPRNFQLVIHGSFNSVEETIEACRHGQENGAIGVLLAYDPNFYPRSEDDIVEYTRRVSEGTDLGIIIFGVTTWGFARFHPSQFSLRLIERLADLETAMAIKYEANHPGLVTGMAEVVRRVGQKLVVSDPMEFNGPGWVELFGMQWMGTSGYEYYGDRVPRWFALMQEGKRDEALELYWSYAPGRKARGALHGSIAGAKLIHRPAWKYMGWLQGFNGGPLRMPQMRLDGAVMKSLREGLEKSGYDLGDEPDEAFFEGRNPA
jgi:dihydrodipicolinate synthase/N-acetylneuraminate lyase